MKAYSKVAFEPSEVNSFLENNQVDKVPAVNERKRVRSRFKFNIEFPSTKIKMRIRDVLFVNQLEKRLGRSLTRLEVETEEYEGEIYLEFPDGHREYIAFPRLDFPEELLSRSGL